MPTKRIVKITSKPKSPVTSKQTKTSRVSGQARLTKVSKISPGKLLNIRHFDFKVNKQFKFKTLNFKKEVLRRLKNSPKDLEITLEPVEGDNIVYHPTSGFTSLESPRAQLSVMAIIYNKGSISVDLDSVVFEYKKNNQTVEKEIYLPSDQLIIDPWYAWAWQNSRPYHEYGDVIFLEQPFPDKLKISFHFKNYSDPITITKNLKPYSNALALPFNKKDFGKDEYVTTYSMHGGGDQVFGYDIGAHAYEKSYWTDLHKDKKGDENSHFRIWDKPVYAMADGKVLHFENNIPNNWKPDGSDEGMEKQKNELWGSYDFGGSGNHFYIKHGNVVALYAHLKKGSLNSKFRQVGKTVKKGDFLGNAGNSGNSSGPHLHIHIKSYKNDSEPEGGAFRPLIFNNGFVIGMEHYPKPKSNVNWAKLNKQGIPGLKSKACFVYPSDTHPYCEYPTNWGEVCRFGVPENIYQEEFDKAWTCGYYPVWVDGYDVGGKTYFNVIFRPSANVNWAAQHNMDGTTYKKEFKKWDDAGYRLININSYLLKGKIRYAAIWKHDSSIDWFAYHGKTLSWHESNFEKHWKAGWVPANVSCVYSGGTTYVTALWEKKNTGGFYLKPAMSLQDFVNDFKQFSDKEKFKLVYLDAYVKNGSPRLSGIWYKNAPNFNSWWEKYNQTGNQLQTNYNSMLKNGYLTRCIAGYNQGGNARFEGIWSK